MPSCTSLHSLIPLVSPCMLITNPFESLCRTLVIPCTTLDLFLHSSYAPLGPLALPLQSLYPCIPLVPPCTPLYPIVLPCTTFMSLPPSLHPYTCFAPDLVMTPCTNIVLHYFPYASLHLVAPPCTCLCPLYPLVHPLLSLSSPQHAIYEPYERLGLPITAKLNHKGSQGYKRLIYMSHFSYACKTERQNGISRLISKLLHTLDSSLRDRLFHVTEWTFPNSLVMQTC